MPGSVTATEAQGQPTIPASADFAVCVIGCSTLNPLGAGPGPVSPPYSVPATFAEQWGLGDGVDCVTQAITPTQGNPAPPAVCFYQTPATNDGVRGVLDTSGITGTAVVTQTAATYPVGTYEPVCEVVDDGNDGDGGLIGTEGIVLRFSPDGGRSWLPSVALGTAFSIAMQIAGQDTGVEYDIAPATTNAAYVALAVELRADTLAHHANAVAHDGADTNAGQVALAASSVPATVTASTAVVNLVLTALQLHAVNITTVHDGPDLPAYTALAALSAATNTREGIDLAIALKDILNDHEARTVSSSAAGLKAATTVSMSPVTVLAAELLSGGVAAILAQPRRLVFTTSGSTPSDAPASVTIVGTDYADAAQTESGLALAQTAASVTSTKAFKTITSIAYLAGDGTDAAIAIGYSNGVHNSADATNTITADDPTYGTLKTGDTWGESKTTPPMWDAVDLYDAGPPADGAFASIARSSTAFAILAISEPVASADFATLTAGLNYLATFNKFPALLVRFRDPDTDETDAAYILAFQAFAAANSDDRIGIVVGSGWLTDAFRSFRYWRSGLPAVLARMQSFATIPGKLGERMAQSPGYVARGPLEFFDVVDDDGNLIDQAHDEAVTGGIDGPIMGTGGGITFYYQRIDTLRGTYVSEMPVLYPATSKILTWMDRRVGNGIKTMAVSIAWLEIQGAVIYDGETLELDQDIRDSIQTKIASAIKTRYRAEFQNADDPNLVVVDPTVSVDGSKVTISGTVYWRPYGYTDVVALTFDASR